MYTSIYCNHKKKKSCTDFGVYPWVKDFPILGNQVLLPSFCHVHSSKTEFYTYGYWGAPLYKPKTHSSNQTSTYNFLSHTVKKAYNRKESLIKTSALFCCLALYLSNPCLQRGQQDIIRSHWSTHLRWNIWEHGNFLTSSLSLYLARQIQHSCQYHHTNVSKKTCSDCMPIR